MPEPASPRPLAGPGGNGADSSEGRLGELRRLIVGPEQAHLQKLQDRLDDPDVRAQEISQALSNARVRRPLEQVLRAILKRDPNLVAESVRPIVLATVRRAVAGALREFAESLNQIAEKSASPRALRWRFEAFRTGKRFSEIVLSKSLLYTVREVFLIHRKTGILLQQAARKAATKDGDMISSMFTAIQEFVRDSFIGTESRELETIDLGSFKLWIQHGEHTMVAGAVSGSPPVELRRVFRGALEEIERDYASQLRSFEGDVAPFEPAHPILERCLLGQSPAKPRRTVLPWLLAGLLFSALVVLASLAVAGRLRWSSYVSRLSAEPGIVVTSAERQGSGYVVRGLRDTASRDPAALLDESGIARDRVTFRMEPYLSLDPQFAIARDFESAKSSLEQSAIRFPLGKSDLSPEELDHVDTIAARIRAVLQAAAALRKTVTVEVIGHTDELGPEQTNARLSQDRTEQVAEALAAAGIGRQFLVMHGVGASQPLRSGSSERDRSFNRSVSFRVRSDR